MTAAIVEAVSRRRSTLDVMPDPMTDVREVTARFASGDAEVRDVWSTFHGNLYDLCKDEPLSGDLLRLFRALESWEAAVGDERQRSEDLLRDVCASLSSATD